MQVVGKDHSNLHTKDLTCSDKIKKNYLKKNPKPIDYFSGNSQGINNIISELVQRPWTLYGIIAAQ